MRVKTLIFQFIKDPLLYRYILAGGFAALVDLSLFFLLKKLLSFHYLIIATLSFWLAVLVNYFLCSRFVFQYHHQYQTTKRIILTYFVGAVGLLIHHCCLFLSLEWFMLPIILSKLFAMGFSFVWNFLSRKYLVFKAA